MTRAHEITYVKRWFLQEKGALRFEQLPVHWAELRESCLNHIPPPCRRKTPALNDYTPEMISSWLYLPHQKQARFREGNSSPSAMNYVASVIKILIRRVGGREARDASGYEARSYLTRFKARTIDTQSSTQVCQTSPHFKWACFHFQRCLCLHEDIKEDLIIYD